MGRGAIIAAIIGAVAIVAAAILQWDWIAKTVEDFVSNDENSESVAWKGAAVGELIDHIQKQPKLREDFQIHLSPNIRMNDLKYLLADRENAERKHVAPDFRSMLGQICEANRTCLICSWSSKGNVVTFDLRRDCVEKIENSAYYFCKTRC